MSNVEVIKSSGHSNILEVRREDLTIDNIRIFFRHVALKILDDAEKAPELVAKCNYAYGRRVEWLGQETSWETFLTRVVITLNLRQRRKDVTDTVRGVALDELFKIAGMERIKRKRETLILVRGDELKEQKVEAVLRDAAERFLGDPNLAAEVSTSSYTLVPLKDQKVMFCSRMMNWMDFIFGCALRLGFAETKTDAAKCQGEVLDKLFEIAGIKRHRKQKVLRAHNTVRQKKPNLMEKFLAGL